GGDHLDLDVGDVRHARHFVVAVVRLQHPPVTDGDLLAQHVAQRVDDAALGLRRDITRLHGEPGVDGGPEIVDLDLASGATARTLGAARRQGVVLHHGADTETASVARPRPIGHFRYGAQQRLHPRLTLRQREPERDRIEAAVLGDLVKQALGREGIVGVADATKGREPRAAHLDDRRGRLVRNSIRRDRRALHDDAIKWRRLRAIGDRCIGSDRFRDHAVVPGDQLAAGIEPRFDMMCRHWAELAARHVVLASPDQFDRLAARLGEANRVDDYLLLAATTVTAAEEMLMQGDVRAVYLQEAGNLVVQARRALGSGPDLDRLAVGADRRGGGHRLHLGMVQIARAVFAPVDLDGAAHCRAGVADRFIRHAFAALVAPYGGDLLQRFLAVVVGARRTAPRDLEQILGGLGGFDAGPDDAAPFRQFHNVGDARHLP